VCRWCARGVGRSVRVAAGSRWGGDAVAGRDHPDGLGEVGGAYVFEEEPGGTGPQRVKDVLVGVERGQDKYPGGGRHSGQFLCCGATVHDRHADVHEDDVGVQLGGEAHRVGPVYGFADYFDVGFGLQDQSEPGRSGCWSSASSTRIVMGLRRRDR
jgi:hypothetical protein